MNRILSILVTTFIVASALLGLQPHVSFTVFALVSLVTMGPLLFAAYNNCKTVLKKQGLPMNHTRSRTGR